jgi:hypothetical protein
MKKVLLIICFVAATAYANAQAQDGETQFIALDLTNPTQPTELIYTENDSSWIETFSDQPLRFQQFTFTHNGTNNPYTYWDGFTVSTSGDSSNRQDWVDSPGGCVAGGGLLTPTSGNIPDVAGFHGTPGLPYLIAAKPMMGEAWEINFDQLYKPYVVWIANHPYPFHVNIHGNQFSRPLNEPGDFLKVIITGHNDQTGYSCEVEHYLARFDDGRLVQTPYWTTVILSQMEHVNRLSFDMQSSDTDPILGMFTPAYFCLTGLMLLDNQQSNTYIDKTNVFPSPFTHTLNVTGVNVHYVNVFTTNGVLVKQVKGNNANTLQLNTSNWQQGNYIIQVNDDDGAHVHKVVKK